MQTWTLVLLLLCYVKADDPVDDFSEFDNAESFDAPVVIESGPNNEDVDVKKPQQEVFEEEEFVSLDEEFEAPTEEVQQGDFNAPHPEKKISPLTFADIPSHFRSNWSSYQVEAVALVIVFIYAVNFLLGKSKNQALANKWYADSAITLRQQFSLVGDDGTSQEPIGGSLIKDTEYSYSLWCSGRAGVKGMLSQLKLVKRQDLVGLVLNCFSPRADRIVHRIDLDPQEMDTFVMVLGLKKSIIRLVKEYPDLSTFAVERKPQIPLPNNFLVYAEVSETIPALLDNTVQQFFKRYEHLVDYFHFSDQYVGPKGPDDSVARFPENSPTLTFSYFLDESADEETERIVLQFTFIMIDKIRKYRLSREGKLKADKKRRSVEEAYLKNTHQQRQEAAQARREERSRERKEKLLQEEDPDKQRKLQKLEDKKNNKLKLPKMKQLRVK
ncbi:unnamed protein product [Bursaphelenchus xylophilus]|uniref:PAT complex subunit CCDC47 n=1 Tax=Bursaphelenchus xylophilus TaxID=6326 RepID=A0A1I7STD5_BURXY|nr:unnamed protein product [Bursaphelenchus xylophilus]CAG9108539.1 unnamed protein product [Bursaphelenchus xylophilus]